MKVKKKDGRKEKLSETAASGIVALIFLILGFQLAVFVMKVVQRPAPAEAVETAAEARPAATAADEPGAVLQRTEPAYGRTGSRSSYPAAKTPQQRNALGGYDAPEPQYRPRPARKVESFRFDPNTVSLADLVRLGLSERQAESIENYRSKGGRFSSKADFKKMYVVSDSLYERLEPFIDIPKVELNTADSTTLVSLRGIGPFYARKIMEYREQLGGYYSPEQVLEVYGMDEERFAPLRECVKVDVSLIRPLDIWGLPEDSLALHPYLGRGGARSIMRFRRICPDSLWTTASLLRENVLDSAAMTRLRHYVKE